VHPASAVSHRRGLAWSAAPGTRPTTRALMHYHLEAAAVFGLSFCMGLILLFRSIPTPRGLDHPDHCLTSSMHMDVFHGDLLLAFSPVSIERFEQRCAGAGELICLVQTFPPTFESPRRCQVCP
jgi:hypothetical protein